jgi:hypothetical protein
MKVQSMSMKQEIAQQSVMATPAVGVSSLVLFGVPISTYIAVGTLLLLSLQIGYLLHKWILLARAKEDACSSND